MAVDSYNPRYTVTLIKTVQRTNGVAARYSGAARQVDLTPYLGDSGAITVAKSISAPSGVAVITLPDIYISSFGDSPYALIEPMDCIEIRGARWPQDYAGKKLPLIMRGYVRRVGRSEAMGDGVPVRGVTVEMHDSGKLWENFQVFWQIAASSDQAYLTAFGLIPLLGLQVDTASLVNANDWVTKMVNVMNAKVADLASASNQIIPPFMAKASVPEGLINVKAAAGALNGNMWSILTTFVDRPWNECFIQDTEAGPQVVFRPAPYYDISGKLIMQGATDPGGVTLDIADDVDIEVARSDDRVANVFFCAPGSSLIDSDMEVVASIVNGPNVGTYGNCLIGIYGPRLMQAQTNLVPAVANIPALLPQGQREPAVSQFVTWHKHRAEQLQLMNQDNIVFEEGSITAKGGEDILAGTYAYVTRGNITWKAYITGLQHTMGPYRPWVTTCQVMRGTGFLERNKLNKPWLSESREGPYSLPAGSPS